MCGLLFHHRIQRQRIPLLNMKRKPAIARGRCHLLLALASKKTESIHIIAAIPDPAEHASVKTALRLMPAIEWSDGHHVVIRVSAHYYKQIARSPVHLPPCSRPFKRRKV